VHRALREPPAAGRPGHDDDRAQHLALLVNATLSADAATQPGTIALGRAWDEGVASGSYVAGTSPNGQLLIRNSTLGSHIRAANPWDKSTSGREYSDTGNRFAEHRNSTAP
jgi:pectinesterase